MAKFLRKLNYIKPERLGIRFNTIAGTSYVNDFLVSLFRFCFKKTRNNAIINFEKSFGKLTNTEEVISFGAGRMALYAILESMEIGEEDEVIIPAFTCVVVPNAILYKKAKPVYVDIALDDFNIDVNLIREKITPRTKAIYAQHTFGLPCNVAGLKQIAKEFNLFIIEDAAHCLGGSYKNNKIGSLGDAAFFSTDHSKMISTHLGGIATTNSREIGKKLRTIQKNANNISIISRQKIAISFLLESFLFSNYFLWLGKPINVVLVKMKLIFGFGDELLTSVPQNYPFPSRMSKFQALLGMCQIKRLDQNLNHRFKIIKSINNVLKCYNYQDLVKNNLALLRYSFLVEDRAEFEKKFSRYFDLQIWFTSVLHMRQCGLDEVLYIKNSCPNAEFAAKHIVNFPTHPKIQQGIIDSELSKNLSWLESNIIKEMPNKK